MERDALLIEARSKAMGLERTSTVDELNPTEERATNVLTAHATTPVNRRLVMAGFAGLGAAALIGAKLTAAQAESSDDDEDDDDDMFDDDDLLTPEQEAALLALYNVFLTSVSTELGAADTASVDLAIRNGLKAVVDQRFADGNISANSADARKAAIETAVVPIFMHGRGWDDDREFRRSRRSGNSADDSGSDSNTDDTSDDNATPTTGSCSVRPGKVARPDDSRPRGSADRGEARRFDSLNRPGPPLFPDGSGIGFPDGVRWLPPYSAVPHPQCRNRRPIAPDDPHPIARGLLCLNQTGLTAASGWSACGNREYSHEPGHPSPSAAAKGPRRSGSHRETGWIRQAASRRIHRRGSE